MSLLMEVNCQEVIRELSNYVDNDVGADLRLLMEKHLKKCAHCTAILDGTRNVVRLVASERLFVLPEGFSQRLWKRISAGAD